MIVTIFLQATAKLLNAVLCATIKPTFHKINVHAAMTPAEIEQHFKPAFQQAKELRDAYHRSKERAEGTDHSLSVDDTDGSLFGLRRSSTGKRSVLQSMVTNVLTAPVIVHGIEEKSEKKFLHRLPFVTVCFQDFFMCVLFG